MTTLPARIGAVLALAIGTALLWAVPAQAAPGDLDPSFGGDGTVTLDVAEEQGNAVALAPDGDIVVVGTVTEETGGTIITREEDLLIARLRPDGSLDPEFGGGDGLVRTDVDAGSIDAANAVAIHTDGTITVAGRSREHFMVARYTENGALDPSFGGDGIVTLSIGLSSRAEDVLVEPDGQIVVAGASATRSGASFTEQQQLARFDADGTLDASFATLGVATGDEGRFERVGLDGAGRIVAAGGTGDDFAVARYTSDGLADPAFSGDGKTTTDFGAFEEGVRGMAVGADGSIVAAGDRPAGDFLVARYTPAGALDPAFAGDGTLVDNLGGDDRAGAVALQPDGKVVVAGFRFGSDLRFAVVRYQADGSRDPAFGAGGLVVGPPSTAAADAVLQPDGKILVAGGEFVFGESGVPSEQDVAVARLLGGEPQPPPPPPQLASPTIPAPIPGATAVPCAPGTAGGVRCFAAAPGSGAEFAAAARALCAESGLRPGSTVYGRVIVGTPADERIVGTDGDDVIVSAGGEDDVNARGGGDCVGAGDGDDDLDGGDGDDLIAGADGDDEVDAGDGADRVVGGRGRDQLSGGRGGDRINGGAGNDRLRGGSGKDRLSGDAGSDRLIGGSGNDRLIGRRGNDRLSGQRGRDVLAGGPGRDRLLGGSGRDRLRGSAGRDRLIGGPGSDRIRGDRGRDVFSGGPGRDAINARGQRRELVSCGSGRDRVRTGRREADRIRRDCERVRRSG